MPVSKRNMPGASDSKPALPGFPIPYWSVAGACLYLGDVRTCLRQLPSRSVHCVITSPPYWNLRDYETGTWNGGSTECNHVQGFIRGDTAAEGRSGNTLKGVGVPAVKYYKDVCARCGAKRSDNQIGLEDTPDCLGWATGQSCGACFVCAMVEVFAEVKRVLRDDGTLWLNLGSSYFSSSSRPLRPHRASACGTYDRALEGYPGFDYVCSCLCDECLDSLSSRRVRNGLPPLEVSSPFAPTNRGISPVGSVGASLDASPLSVPHSTTASSPQNVQVASDPLTTASVHLPVPQTSQHFSQGSARMVRSTDDTDGHQHSLAAHTEGKELFCVACGNSFRERVGKTIHNCTTDSLNYLKPGDDVGIPWRVALALQADGWILRQDIIWHAPNKMPESVTDRCTKSHEHIFLLAKGTDYYFDGLAIAEEGKSGPLPCTRANGERVDETKARGGKQRAGSDGLVNKRDVWTVPTQGYKGAHFACFSPRLMTPCILAGTSEHGACAACGKPYERVVVRTGGRSVMDDGMSRRTPPGQTPQSHHDQRKERDRSFEWSRNGKSGTGSTLDGTIARRETVGWRKTCGCATEEVVPCVVLDPFVGSGTTVATSLQLGRNGVGIDLNETYLQEHAIPRIEAALVGERAKRETAALPPDAAPAARRLRG